MCILGHVIYIKYRYILGLPNQDRGMTRWPPSRTAAPPGRIESISHSSEKAPLSVTSSCSQKPPCPITHRDRGRSPQRVSLGKLLNHAFAYEFASCLGCGSRAFLIAIQPHIPQLSWKSHTHLTEKKPSLWSLTVYHNKRFSVNHICNCCAVSSGKRRWQDAFFSLDLVE